ncbi:MAG: uncharacterized protein K0R15_2571 [Clostridiales bacterium]|jgi:sigma-E factor negative regulatory protein RseC|nr:uncharacterized protein [Clostridiales bacterium]
MEYGIVKEKKHNIVVVSMVRTDACAQCRACSMGHEEKEMIIEASNDCEANVGDKVGIQLSTEAFMSAVLIMYAIPLLGFFIGIGAGYGLSFIIFNEVREYIPIMLGIGFLAVSFLIIRLMQNKLKAKKYNPKAIKVERGDLNEGNEFEVKSK